MIYPFAKLKSIYARHSCSAFLNSCKLANSCLNVLKYRSITAKAWGHLGLFMLCVIPCALQKLRAWNALCVARNCFDVSYEPRSECSISAFLASGCAFNAFFSVLTARSAVMFLSVMPWDDALVIQIDYWTVIHHFATHQRQVGEVNAPLLIYAVCFEIAIELIFKTVLQPLDAFE